MRIIHACFLPLPGQMKYTKDLRNSISHCELSFVRETSHSWGQGSFVTWALGWVNNTPLHFQAPGKRHPSPRPQTPLLLALRAPSGKPSCTCTSGSQEAFPPRLPEDFCLHTCKQPWFSPSLQIKACLCSPHRRPPKWSLRGEPGES